LPRDFGRELLQSCTHRIRKKFGLVFRVSRRKVLNEINISMHGLDGVKAKCNLKMYLREAHNYWNWFGQKCTKSFQ